MPRDQAALVFMQCYSECPALQVTALTWGLCKGACVTQAMTSVVHAGPSKTDRT